MHAIGLTHQDSDGHRLHPPSGPGSRLPRWHTLAYPSAAFSQGTRQGNARQLVQSFRLAVGSRSRRVACSSSPWDGPPWKNTSREAWKAHPASNNTSFYHCICMNYVVDTGK